jgi:anti-anti-sigma factor|tara:strand:+ start:32238 stop:32639 length:402 start_codon:yes stop_codon:yes gene_type:complete
MAAFQPVHGCSFRLSRRLLASRFQDVPDQECHMTITSQPSTDGQELTISISGRFDFNAHQAFRDAYQRQDVNPQRYVVNLQGTTYMDSSALGMLLLLRDHAGGDEADIRLLNCNGDVRKILSVSNFEQLFVIA